MRFLTPVFNIIALLVIIIEVAIFNNMSNVVERDFDQARYSYAVGEATEAMFRSTLNTNDINLDYDNPGYIALDSSDALEVFDRVMCMNYDMSPSVENFDAINQSIVCCTLAGYDGYYITKMYKDDIVADDGNQRDGYRLRFSPKIPYVVNRDGITYGVNLFNRTYISMKDGNLNANPKIDRTGLALPAGVTDAELGTLANKQVRSAMLSEMKYSENPNLGEMNYLRLYFPDTTTKSGVNPLSIPGIFLMMKSCDYVSRHEIRATSVSGYKVIPKVNVVTFRQVEIDAAGNPIKDAHGKYVFSGPGYYCYETQLKPEEKVKEDGGIAVGGKYGTYKILDYYANVQQASDATYIDGIETLHYNPHVDVLARKIVKNQSFK